MKITNGRINQAGYRLAGKTSTLSDDDANIILKDFRYTHRHPMDLLKKTINRKLTDHHIKALVSQRLKRIPSIVKKLENQQSMKLAVMQDIGGLRIVVNDTNEVYLIKDAIRKAEEHGGFKFTFKKEKDYIKYPKDSGYRGIHLMYKYNKNVLPEEQQCRVEIQIRTKFQHFWATAVEVLGTYLSQSLKQSDGDEKYLNIFKDISKLFVSLENKEVDDYKFFEKVENDIRGIKLFDTLRKLNNITKDFSDKAKGQYLLLKMDTEKESVNITQYSEARFKQANENYLEMELDNRDNKAVEVVLISIQDIKKLKQSYPNYFMDTTEFIKNLNKLFKSTKRAQGSKEMIDGEKGEQKRVSKKLHDDIFENILKLFNGSKK